MATTLLETRIATGNAQALDTVPAPIAKSRKSRTEAYPGENKHDRTYKPFNQIHCKS